jgi:hypothetical protein
MRSDPLEQTVPNDTQVLSFGVVPPGKQWKLRRLNGACRAYGYFEIWADATRLARVNSSPGAINPYCVFDPYDIASAGQEVEVRYTQSYGPPMDVGSVLFFIEDDA